MINLLLKTSLLLALLLPNVVQALPSTQWLVVSDCELSSHFAYQSLAKAQGLHLIKTQGLLGMQAALQTKPRYCQGFMNVTEAWLLDAKKDPQTFLKHFLPDTHPSDFTQRYHIQYRQQVESLLDQVNENRLKQSLKKLSHYPDRYANSKTGQAAVLWLQQQLSARLTVTPRQDVKFFLVPTPKQRQPSLVLRIGQETSKEPAVILGASIDTWKAGFAERQPGADEASGAAVLLETARLLLDTPLTLQKPVYFIWYAGKKLGNLGSQQMVHYFNSEHIPVEAVLQLDMAGYAGNHSGIGLVDNMTDASLTGFVADLSNAYLHEPAGVVRCNYACSDHSTWYQNGNRVVYPFEMMEEEGNPYVNTDKDTLDKLSLSHLANFVRLSLAFVVEMAGSVEKKLNAELSHG